VCCSSEKKRFKHTRSSHTKHIMDIASLSETLRDQTLPIQDRFRALFTLRSLEKNPEAVAALVGALKDVGENAALSSSSSSSLHADALFRHEVAFALGQMRAKEATQTLIAVLKNQNEHGMTRHECAEALGAIADETSLEVLRDMREDAKHREVRETASLALRRVEHVVGNSSSSSGSSSRNVATTTMTGALVGSKKESTAVVVDDEEEDGGGYATYSVDPVPAMDESVETETLADIILDDAADIWDRYAAMFALRNRAQKTFGLTKKTKENEQLVQLCSSTLGKTLRSETVQSALLKHEICYVLGQLRDDDDNEIARKALFECLEDPNEHAMVRHEAAEAIGSRGGQGAEAILRKYLACEDRVVSESCEVALDMLRENEEGTFVAL
jgi:deoxyhypusine monooxygenase